jgi:hypothetical protein
MPVVADTTTPRSAITYATLRSGIAGWLHRSDLESFLPDVVRLAESDIRNDVRVRAMEATATGTVASNVITLPADLIELRRLVIDGYVYTYSDPIEFAELERQGSTDYVFTAIGQTLKVLTGTSYSLIYWAPLTELINDSDSNWLLQNAMDVYLWGCLKHASLWAADDQGVMKFDAMYKGAAARINDREAKAMAAGGRMLMGTDIGMTSYNTSIFTG